MLVAQNGVPRADLGTTTSAVTFLRQIGASAGVAVGRRTDHRPVRRTAARRRRRPAARAAAGALSADRASRRCRPTCRPRSAAAYGAAVPPVFGYVAPLLGVAFLLALALPVRPLRETAYADDATHPDLAAEE